MYTLFHFDTLLMSIQRCLNFYSTTTTHTYTHTLSGTLESHCSTQLERLDEHTEIRNHKQQSKKYYELVGKGASLLETKFDELHSQHVQLKAVHKKVSQAVNGMEEYCETLEAQNGEIAETCTHLQSELQARMGE